MSNSVCPHGKKIRTERAPPGLPGVPGLPVTQGLPVAPSLRVEVRPPGDPLPLGELGPYGVQVPGQEVDRVTAEGEAQGVRSASRASRIAAAAFAGSPG